VQDLDFPAADDVLQIGNTGGTKDLRSNITPSTLSRKHALLSTYMAMKDSQHLRSSPEFAKTNVNVGVNSGHLLLDVL
jgi:hypothetical protein